MDEQEFAMLYPIGIQDFESIRRDGYVYVDKTELIYQLFKTGKYYFLSRPRRFGKSLLLSTMEAYFAGRKDLFDGLAMADLEKDWIRYPVLWFDLGGKQFKSISDLTEVLYQHLAKMEEPGAHHYSHQRHNLPSFRPGSNR